MWNDLYPDNPVHDICEYSTKQDSRILEVLPELVNDLTTLSENLTEENPIWEEILVFKNIQAQYKRILHCDKCLQLLQRVGVCLRKIVLVNLSKTYLELAERILSRMNNTDCDTYFLPSRQQLEFVLVRTQTAAKLICEALHYSRKAFCFLIQKLKIGHLIINLMMAASVTARLNIVFKGILVQSFRAYKILFEWRSKLKKGGWEWPKPLDLPEDLEVWIAHENSEQLIPENLPQDQLNFLTNIFSKKKNQDMLNSEEGMDDEVIPLENTSSDDNSNCNIMVDLEKDCVIVEDNIEMNIDEGVPIERSHFEKTESCISVSDNESEEIKDVTPVKERKETLKLTKAQKRLLKKIKSTENMKQLKVIWDNLDVTSKDLVPKRLTPAKIRRVDKVFVRLKQTLSQLYESDESDEEKMNKSNLLLKMAQLKFAELLQLMPAEKSNLKPAKTFKELNNLYKIIKKKLENSKNTSKCEKLKKTFKNRKADIKLLVESNERESAKELIHSTSKLFLIKYLKFF